MRCLHASCQGPSRTSRSTMPWRSAVPLGFEFLRVKGTEQINLQNRGGQAKPYQLHQLVALIRRYDLTIEEDR